MTPESRNAFNIERLERGADQLRDLRINVRTIYDAIDTKIDVERLIRRVVRDLKAQTPDPTPAI